MARLTPAFVRRGAWVRPFGKLVYTMPPFLVTRPDLRTITSAMHGALREMEEPEA